MTQRFESDLRRFHELFMGGRCSGWQQEELLVAAIQSDTRAQHQVFWREAGHDDEADIRVQAGARKYAIEIKSGKMTKQHLILSGHRLGRFRGDLGAITDYLQAKRAQIITVPCAKIDDERGRQFVYRLGYIDVRSLTSLNGQGWKKTGAAWEQTNRYGVVSSLRPSMSWQIWWQIPLEVIAFDREIVIA